MRDGEFERDVRGDGVDDAASGVGAGGGMLRAVGGGAAARPAVPAAASAGAVARGVTRARRGTVINDDSVGGTISSGDDLDAVRGWMKTKATRDVGVGVATVAALARGNLGRILPSDVSGSERTRRKRGGERERLRERKAKAHAPTLVYQGRMSSLRKHARQSHRRPHASE